jgi:hypothetical protein
VDLSLLGVTGPDDGLLDEVCGVFGDGDAGERRDEQRDAPGVAKLQRRLGVLVDEGLLDPDPRRARSRA